MTNTTTTTNTTNTTNTIMTLADVKPGMFFRKKATNEYGTIKTVGTKYISLSFNKYENIHERTTSRVTILTFKNDFEVVGSIPEAETTSVEEAETTSVEEAETTSEPIINGIITVNTAKATLDINNVTIPSIVINKITFLDAVNATLIQRYINEYRTKEYNTSTELNQLQRKYNMTLNDKDSMEDTDKLLNSIHIKESTLNKFRTILSELEKTAEYYNNVIIPDDLNIVVSIFSAIYSTAIDYHIDNDKSKAVITNSYIKGWLPLFTACKEYVSKYETSEEWTDGRKKDFNTIKQSIITIGSRLDCDGTENCKKFKFRCTSKSAIRLINMTAKHYIIDKKTGEHKDKNNCSESEFHSSLLATILHLENAEIHNSNIVEF